MKKILSVILTLTFLILSAVNVSAENLVQEGNAITFPGWKLTKSSSVKVERCFDSVTNSWTARITNDGTGKDIYAFEYTVPKELLSEGTNYTITFYMRCAGTSDQWVYISCGGTKFSNSWVGNHKKGGSPSISMGTGLYDKNVITFGIDSARAEVVYLDNITIINQDTGETVLSFDFESTVECTPVENLSYIEGVLTWTLPQDMSGDAVNIYKRELDGSKQLLNTSPILAESMSAELNIVSEKSFYIDVYTCYSGIESEIFASVASLGNVDFGDCTLKRENGLWTVTMPVRNNFLEDGFDFELIVLVKDEMKTVKAKSVPYTAGVSEEFEDYTVELEGVDGSTTVEVYVWDSIDDMNVLWDVTVF